MDTRNLALRTAKAKLANGRHLQPLPTIETFARYIMERTAGTATNAEINTMYAEEKQEWDDALALPGVEIGPDGCAHMPDEENRANIKEIDPHTYTNPADFIPDTVEELLANTTADGPEIVFQMAIIKTDDNDDETTYAQTMEIVDKTFPLHQLIAMLRGAATVIEEATP